MFMYLLTFGYLLFSVLNLIYSNYTVLDNSQTIKTLYFAFWNASFHTYSIPQALGTIPFILLHVQVHYWACWPSPALLTDRYSTSPLSHSLAYLRSPCKHLLLLSPITWAITDLFRTLFGDKPITPQTPTHLLAVPPQSGLLFYSARTGAWGWCRQTARDGVRMGAWGWHRQTMQECAWE